MKKTVLLWMLAMFTGSTYASAFVEPDGGQFYGGIGVGVFSSEINNAERKREEDDGRNATARLFSGVYLSSNVALELGAVRVDDLVYKDQDATGQYELTFERYDIYFGPVVQFKPRWFIPIRLMAAVTYSHITMEVEESFWGLSPSGKVTETDSVTGAHLSVGVLPFQRRHFSGLVSIDYIYRPDFFDDSSRPFTSEEIGIGFRMAFH